MYKKKQDAFFGGNLEMDITMKVFVFSDGELSVAARSRYEPLWLQNIKEVPIAYF